MAPLSLVTRSPYAVNHTRWAHSGSVRMHLMTEDYPQPQDAAILARYGITSQLAINDVTSGLSS